MKTQDIKRGITSRHFRLGGSSPAIGALARLRDTEMLPRGERRSRRRGRSHTVDKRSARLWLILLGGGTLVVITTAVFLWLMPRFDPEAMEIRSLVAEDAKKVRVPSRFPSPSREESLKLVRRALATRDPAAAPDETREDAERRPLAHGITACRPDLRAVIFLHAVQQLVRETRLAPARLAGDEDGARHRLEHEDHRMMLQMNVAP